MLIAVFSWEHFINESGLALEWTWSCRKPAMQRKTNSRKTKEDIDVLADGKIFRPDADREAYWGWD
ncbi:MAG: hypothetical protein LBQ54_02555 [Planctomycetaceae bacterium]|nr:hypothetical protein [Planctomycetaceae bacterium]